MTQEEIKKLDKKINAVQDPLGRGFPILYRILQDTAFAKSTTNLCILREYSDWKMNKTKSELNQKQ